MWEQCTLKEMCMRKVLFEDLSREDLPYPMNKMLEGLDRLPGNYTVTQSSLEVIKDKVKERKALSENDEKHLSKLYKVEKGSKIEITKVMSGDPPFKNHSNVLVWTDHDLQGKFKIINKHVIFFKKI